MHPWELMPNDRDKIWGPEDVEKNEKQQSWLPKILLQIMMFEMIDKVV